MNIQGIGQSFGMFSSSAMSGSRRAGPGFDPPQPPDAETIMEQDDADQDGQLTIDETPLTEEIFSDADTDGDGYLSSAELDEFITSRPPPMGGPEGMGPPPEPMDASSIMKNEDTDADGSISLEESSLPDSVFSLLDTNQDGQISLEELEAANVENESNSQAGSGQESSRKLRFDLAMDAYQKSVTGYMGSLGQTGESGMFQNLFTDLIA